MELHPEITAFGIVAMAGFLGGAVGLEREIARKPAGMRTHILVAAGSALLVLLAESSIDFFQRHGDSDAIKADSIRVMQAIVVGISFLGAGTIIHRRGNDVEGLTTAASIFLTAGIGIAAGVGRILLALETTFFAILVLIAVRWIEGHLPRQNDADNDADSE